MRLTAGSHARDLPQLKRIGAEHLVAQLRNGGFTTLKSLITIESKNPTIPICALAGRARRSNGTGTGAGAGTGAGTGPVENEWLKSDFYSFEYHLTAERVSAAIISRYFNNPP